MAMDETGQVQSSAWHAGEVAMQRTVGAAERLHDVGARIIRNHLIEQHRLFYRQLPFAVFGSVDPDGDVWATLRASAPGFLDSPDESRLRVVLPRDADDPAEAGMEDGNAIAMLGIELPTRRRNRLNGTIRRSDGSAFDIVVVQSYGNCPKYIQQRHHEPVPDRVETFHVPPRRLSGFDAHTRGMIERADTFFVASYVDNGHAGRQIDVSHRGGNSGFVRVDPDGVLTIPDFAGNQFFNTLGNFTVNPRAGLAFVDFGTGDLLQLSGQAEVILDSPEIATFQGAERLWRFTPRQIVHRPGALPLRWTLAADGWSPYALNTGRWRAETLTRAPAAD